MDLGTDAGNPGNIGTPSKVREVANAAAERNIPIRVGVNAEDASLLAGEGVEVVWSPRCNNDLYGFTAPVTPTTATLYEPAIFKLLLD